MTTKNKELNKQLKPCVKLNKKCFYYNKINHYARAFFLAPKKNQKKKLQKILNKANGKNYK